MLSDALGESGTMQGTGDDNIEEQRTVQDHRYAADTQSRSNTSTAQEVELLNLALFLRTK